MVGSVESGALDLRLLGTFSIRRDGGDLALPASRKVRALVAYLAIEARPVTRTRLCELLWDLPNDPRGELRWCLSKIRGLVDDAGLQRVVASGDLVSLDLHDCRVDAFEIESAVAALDGVPVDRLQKLAATSRDDFLGDVEIDGNPAFHGWLTSQRRRFRHAHVAFLERLTRTASDDEIVGLLDRWLEVAPLDVRVHERLLRTLARLGLIHEGEQHVAGMTRLFEAEALDCSAARESWRAARASRHPGSDDVVAPRTSRRPSIAVMPFSEEGLGAALGGGTGGAIAHDVITRLAKLRSLFVIAQGTVFALHERQVDPSEAARLLDVDYVVSGSVRRAEGRLTVMAQLVEARSARMIWSDVFDRKRDAALLVLDDVGDRIVASIASEIEMLERNLAILRPPNSLDAWGAHHRGLWHVYRFNKTDNDLARHFFETAIRLDPTFARAHAGLSFAHFQSAFQTWGDRQGATRLAFAAAGQALMADERDPAAHLAIGRAFWLQGDFDRAIDELQQSIVLSPNFALGHYSLAFVHSQVGDPLAAIASSDHSRDLSPFDPLLFGMLGARAMALVRLGRFDEAADWGARAASRPNAHAHIHAIAAYSLALAGRLEAGRAHLRTIRAALPAYRVDDFLAAMQFVTDGEAAFRRAATLL